LIWIKYVIVLTHIIHVFIFMRM